MRKPFTPTCANSVTDCGTVFLSKTCTLPRIPCKRKADPCKFLSVQKFVICMKIKIGHFRFSLRPRLHRHECFSLFTFLGWQLLRYEQFFCFEMISSRCKPYKSSIFAIESHKSQKLEWAPPLALRLLVKGVQSV